MQTPLDDKQLESLRLRGFYNTRQTDFSDRPKLKAKLEAFARDLGVQNVTYFLAEHQLAVRTGNGDKPGKDVANAITGGRGNTRCVIISKKMNEMFTDDELAYFLAHELTHAKNLRQEQMDIAIADIWLPALVTLGGAAAGSIAGGVKGYRTASRKDGKTEGKEQDGGTPETDQIDRRSAIRKILFTTAGVGAGVPPSPVAAHPRGSPAH